MPNRAYCRGEGWIYRTQNCAWRAHETQTPPLSLPKIPPIVILRRPQQFRRINLLTHNRLRNLRRNPLVFKSPPRHTSRHVRCIESIRFPYSAPELRDNVAFINIIIIQPRILEKRPRRQFGSLRCLAISRIRRVRKVLHAAVIRTLIIPRRRRLHYLRAVRWMRRQHFGCNGLRPRIHGIGPEPTVDCITRLPFKALSSPSTVTYAERDRCNNRRGPRP